MGRALVAYTVAVGAVRPLWIAKGEDREYRLAFVDGGAPVDMTGAQDVRLRVANAATGQVVCDVPYAGFYGTADQGTPRFVVVPADTAGVVPALYEADVSWRDADGNRSQLLAVSPFVLRPHPG